jgi:hypothetical protein
MTPSDGLDVLLVTPSGCDARMIKDSLKLQSNIQNEVLKDVASAVEIFRARDVGTLPIRCSKRLPAGRFVKVSFRERKVGPCYVPEANGSGTLSRVC